jgi:hypothetical protein
MRPLVLGFAVLSMLASLAVLPATDSFADSGSANSDPSAVEGDQITFGIQPAQRSGGDARPFFAWGVTPGATLRDNVAIVNYSKEPVQLSIYATDALNTDDGGFGLLPTGQQPVDAGSWVHLLGVSGELTVPARSTGSPGQVVVPVEVNVPANATPGDHTAGILAVQTSVDPSDEGTKVTLEQRVGTRVYVRVSGEVQPELTVGDVSARYEGTANPVGGGNATVTYTLTNTGNVNLGAESVVNVDGLLADSSASTPDAPLLLVGGSIEVTANVPDVLPQVRLTAKVNVTPIAAPTDIPTELPVVVAGASFWAIPWVLFGIVIALVLMGLLVHQRRRRRPAARHARSTQAHARSASAGVRA